MKKYFFIAASLFCFVTAAKAQHPLDIKVNFSPTNQKTQLSLEYLAFPKISFEAGIGTKREEREYASILLDSMLQSRYFSSRTLNYFLEVRLYTSEQKIGQGKGFNVGLLLDYEHFSSYKINNEEVETPYYQIGIGGDVGYKWVIWNRLVAEINLQILTAYERYTGNSRFNNYSIFDLDAGFLGKIGYRF